MIAAELGCWRTGSADIIRNSGDVVGSSDALSSRPSNAWADVTDVRKIGSLAHCSSTVTVFQLSEPWDLGGCDRLQNLPEQDGTETKEND